MLYFNITYSVLNEQYDSYVCAYNEEQALDFLSQRKYTPLFIYQSSEKAVNRLYDYSRKGLKFWKENSIKIMHQILYIQDSIPIDKEILDWRELALSDIGLVTDFFLI